MLGFCPSCERYVQFEYMSSNGVRCSNCGWEGFVRPNTGKYRATTAGVCSICGGKGTINNGKPCPYCWGTGEGG